MAYRRHAIETGSHGPDDPEAQALLNDIAMPPRAGDASSSTDSMPSSQTKVAWWSSDRVPALSPTGTDVALESLSSSQDLDSTHLRAQGHEAALKRSFSLLSAIGLGFSITSSWVGYLSNFGQNLIYGGPQVVVFGLFVATFVQCIITLGLSEVASAFPSAGGQYHFTYILAPGPHKRFAAFVVGWMTLLGWWIITSSGISLCAVFVSGLVGFWDSSFEATSWQIYLLYLATILITSSPLFICPRMIPKITRAALFLSVTGFFIVFGLVLGLRKHAQPASYVTQSGLGTSGWNVGTAWILGIGNAMYAYGGIDAAIHIAEEVPNPGKNIPQAMNLTVLIGFVTAFPMSLVLMFSMTDMDAVMSSKLPSAELFYQITGSKTVTTFVMVWIIIIYFVACTSQWVTSGRMAWAFARDQGIPFSPYFSHVSPSLDFPVRATLLSMAFSSLYGLIYLASSTAFNSIITSAVLYLSITYAIPQAIIAFRGRTITLPTNPLSPRALNLGPVLGYACNILSPLLVAVIGTCLCFPPQLPVTTGNANYTPVVLFGLFMVVLGLWWKRGERFVGPKIDWEGLGLGGCR